MDEMFYLMCDVTGDYDLAQFLDYHIGMDMKKEIEGGSHGLISSRVIKFYEIIHAAKNTREGILIYHFLNIR
jgi:hypothetical protein